MSLGGGLMDLTGRARLGRDNLIESRPTDRAPAPLTEQPLGSSGYGWGRWLRPLGIEVGQSRTGPVACGVS